MTKIENATVGKLIAVLQNYPTDAPFRLDDPDTGWLFSTTYIDGKNGAVTLTARYVDGHEVKK
jgi:hypothetical protein